MHTSKDDYLINTLRFVSGKKETQIYGAILPKSLTSPKMKETKAYKTYLGFAIGANPPKIVRKFKKASVTKKDLNLSLGPMDEEPKSAKKKVLAKKTTRKQTSGVVIRDTLVESSSKRKEKVDVASGKGIELLSEVALTEDTYDQENDSDDDKAQSDSEKGPDSEHETDENESGSESDQDENEEDIEDDEDEVKDKFVKTPSNDSDDEDETKITDKAKGDEDEEMDYTTSQLYDDVDKSTA
ncbi:hypothetical protein Tco_0329007 [Tanacetum coccineum]